MRVISISNQKGGCGKTTTAINLASVLALNGRRVLLIDLDPQSHASLGLNIDSPTSIYNVISRLTPRKLKIEDIIIRIEESFDLAPSNILVGTLEQELSDEIGRELKLTEILATIEGKYDEVLIDCPPSLGFLTVNALRASSEVIIPLETSKFSFQGVERLLDIVNLIRDRLGHAITCKVLVTMFDSRLRHSFSMLAKIKERFAVEILSTIIHVNVKLKESVMVGETVTRYDKYSRGFKDYFSLSRELISSWDIKEVASSDDLVPVFHSRINPASFEENASRGESVEVNSPEPQAENRLTREEAGTIISLDDFGAESVYVTGSFNDWSLDESYRLKKEGGKWSIKLPLKPGVYQYKFIIDGKWREDPRNPVQEKNPFGELNSLLEIK